MESPKFSLNAFLLIVIIFSALTFFVTVKLTGMADRTPVNQFVPIEGKELSIRYSSLEPDGIYSGSETVNTLLLEGTYGTDWGAAAVENQLYLNEYRATDLGVLLCDVVRVDTDTFEKTILLHDAILRGRCASGQLVCVTGAMLPANLPEENALCRLYCCAGADVSPTSEHAAVVYLDPDSGAVLGSVPDPGAMSAGFEARYLSRAMEEVLP